MNEQTKARLKLGLVGTLVFTAIAGISLIPRGKPENAPYEFFATNQDAVSISKFYDDGRHGRIIGVTSDKDFDGDRMNDDYVVSEDGTPIYVTHSMDLIRDWEHNQLGKTRKWYKSEEWVRK